MTTGTDPNLMTPAARMGEVSMLLSMGMMRLWLKRHAALGPQRGFSKDSRDSRQVAEDCLELPAAPGPDGTVNLWKE